MRGTPGYLAPEWLSSVITEKVDVYSFGIVVLGIICGRKNLDSSENEEDRHLITLFERKEEEERLQELVDRKEEDGENCCMLFAEHDYRRTPAMSLVVKLLEGFEANLDFDFMNLSGTSTMAASGEVREVVDFASPLLPSILSGPM